MSSRIGIPLDNFLDLTPKEIELILYKNSREETYKHRAEEERLRKLVFWNFRLHAGKKFKLTYKAFCNNHYRFDWDEKNKIEDEKSVKRKLGVIERMKKLKSRKVISSSPLDATKLK